MPRLTGRRAALAGAAVLLGTLSFGGSAFAAGANVSGPYDATPTTISGNGMAYEHAGDHLPLAGTKGKADNKNPLGQLPDGSDANAGYECDTNQGVGQANPAHTSCTPTQAP